jgi:hypothetical protein
MGRKWDRKVPFEKGTDQMLTYDWGGWACEHRDAPPFVSALQFSHFERGRSSAVAVFNPIDAYGTPCGLRYYMFLKDLGDSIPHLKNGVLTGTFKFVKRGANYGVAYDQNPTHGIET